jgi:REP element-mobilizing transposase RayT
MASKTMSICLSTTTPKWGVSVLVNSLKGVSSRMIRQKSYPSLRRNLWGGSLMVTELLRRKLRRRSHLSNAPLH